MARGVALGFEALLARVGLGVASDVWLFGGGAQRPAHRYVPGKVVPKGATRKFGRGFGEKSY